MAETEKLYYHRTPGAKFYMPDGREIAFVDGVLRLSSIPQAHRAAVERELDMVANVPTSHIYTKHKVPAPEERMVESEIMSSAVSGFDSDKKIQGNPPTVPIPVQKAPPPTLQQTGLAAQAEAARVKIAETVKK